MVCPRRSVIPAVTMPCRLFGQFSLVEYCCVQGGTRWSDLKRKHYPEAYNFTHWCVGNEMDGPLADWTYDRQEIRDDWGELGIGSAGPSSVFVCARR